MESSDQSSLEEIDRPSFDHSKFDNSSLEEIDIPYFDHPITGEIVYFNPPIFEGNNKLFFEHPLSGEIVYLSL